MSFKGVSKAYQRSIKGALKEYKRSTKEVIKEYQTSIKGVSNDYQRSIIGYVLSMIVLILVQIKFLFLKKKYFNFHLTSLFGIMQKL